MKSWTRPTDKMIEKVLSSVKKETDRQYFFSRLNNPLWLKPLIERGYFKNPPGVKYLSDGCIQYPNWPEMAYLLNIAGAGTDVIVNLLLELPKTDNPCVYEGILEIALKLKGQESAKLLPKIIEYTGLKHQFSAHRYPELLCHWVAQNNICAALEFAQQLIQFQEDPKFKAKQQARKKNPHSLGTSLEPAPLFVQWEYEQILEKGVQPLTEREPYQVARILIDAAANMIRMTIHQADLDKDWDDDYSEIWCRRLDKPAHKYQNPKETLVLALTHACELVFEKTPESIEALDQALRNQRWDVFKRLRQHLYTLHPTDQTLPWIREFILNYGDYSEWEYHYELQLMIKHACAHFGSRLLSDSERAAIFDAILSGPSKDDIREWMGDRYSEEAFQQQKRSFHHKQLHPFASLLRGDYRHYYDELEGEGEEESISDESYSHYEVRGGFVSYRSPKSAEDLEAFTDEDLLSYLNAWDEEHRERDDFLVKINISALAGVFQTFFKDNILPNECRLAFWMAQRGNITRPIYIAAMTKAMQELVKAKNFEKLDQWIEFCVWVVSHPDIVRKEGQPRPSDESREHPDWRSSRQAVVDFIDACVDEGVVAPISARQGLAKLIEFLCAQFDWRLDCGQPVILNNDDQITEAINNIRSQALQALVRFGFWVRRHEPDDIVPEVATILDKRLNEGAEFRLTRPEYALLGLYFGNLCIFNRDWALNNKKNLFPQADVVAWRDAFGSFIRYNQPSRPTFDVLREDYQLALEHLDALAASKDVDDELIDRLGQHLFAYYLWEVYPLTGNESLLERFYEKTTAVPLHWAQLFDHVGLSLRNSGKNLEKGLVDRIIDFFYWRFKIAEPSELDKFTFWLEAECLDPEWRLSSYSKILDLGRSKLKGLSLEVKTLNKLLPDHLSQVVECFAKTTDAMDQGTHLYVSAEEAKLILRAGLNSVEPSIRENAERARENLLRLGRFDFLDLE